MVCPICNSEKVLVTSEQVSAKGRNRGSGCLWLLARWTLILCTCGLWLLIGRRKGTTKTKFKNQTVGICQSCGHKWNIGA